MDDPEDSAANDGTPFDEARDLPGTHDPEGTAAGDEAASHPDVAAPATGRPIRRHLIVFGILVIFFVIGVFLVIDGRSDQTTTSPPPTVTTVPAASLVTDLGVVADEDAARSLVAGLDPSNLEPGGEPPTTPGVTVPPGVNLSESGLQRCQTAIVQQNTDRSLGDRLAVARLMVGGTPTFVVSYELPPSGVDPAGERVVVVDARTCRILTAVEH